MGSKLVSASINGDVHRKRQVAIEFHCIQHIFATKANGANFPINFTGLIYFIKCKLEYSFQ